MHIFVDIDGVLATEDTWDRWYAEGRPSGARHRLLDPDCVACVQVLCDRVGGRIVISSSWRTLYDWHELVGVLRRAGLEAPIIGATPILEFDTRGAEIAAYIAQHGIDPERTVILEDAEDVAPLEHRCVRTLFRGEGAGFRELHLDEALELLGYRAESGPAS